MDNYKDNYKELADFIDKYISDISESFKNVGADHTEVKETLEYFKKAYLSAHEINQCCSCGVIFDGYEQELCEDCEEG